jgi:hypothetical protein
VGAKGICRSRGISETVHYVPQQQDDKGETEMNDDTEEMSAFFTDSSNYLESLIRSRAHLKDSPKLSKQLDEIIELELEMALIGVKKAKGEVLKDQAKDNVVPLKRPPPTGGSAA